MGVKSSPKLLGSIFYKNIRLPVEDDAVIHAIQFQKQSQFGPCD